MKYHETNICQKSNSDKECQRFDDNLIPKSSTNLEKEVKKKGRKYFCKYCQKTFKYFKNIQVEEHEAAHEKMLNLKGYPKDLKNNPQDLNVDLQELNDDPKDLKNYPKDLNDDPQGLKDDPKDLKDDPKDLKDDQDRYSCKLCAKTFKYLKNFQSHEESRECENACKYCGKKLTTKLALKKHEMIHTGEKPFSCNNCGKSFININSMKRHELIHTGEKPYSCQYCKKKFRHTASLRGHERIHLGKVIY